MESKNYANLALAHFFIGLIKADGGLSKNEIDKVKIIVYKMDHNLPVSYVDFKELFDKMLEDTTLPIDEHLNKAFEYLKLFQNTSEYKQKHLQGIWDIMELIMEIGTITDGEKDYMEKVKNEFSLIKI